MTSIDPTLEKLSNELAAALERLDAANRALEQDRLARSESGWSRFVGAITNTSAKRAVADAETSFASVRSRVEGEVTAWIRAFAIQELTVHPMDAMARSQYKERIRELTSRRDKIEAWFRAAGDACEALHAAELKCRSASKMDTIGAVSSNKAVDFLAYSETSSARDAANRASKSILRLIEFLPMNSDAVEFDAPDGFLAFVVGLDGSFDFLDLLNASKLSRVAENCKQAAERLSTLHTRLKAMLAQANQALAVAAQTLVEFDRAFLKKAYQIVPESIRGQIPISIDVD